jgi:hypothetical protein
VDQHDLRRNSFVLPRLALTEALKFTLGREILTLTPNWSRISVLPHFW